MHESSGDNRRDPRRPSRVYLTAIWGIALGLVGLLVLVACSGAGGTSQAVDQTMPGETRTPYATRTRSSASGSATGTPALSATRSPAVTPSEIRAREEDLRGVRIDFWHAWAGDLEDVLEDIIDEFNRTNRWGIRVNVSSFNGLGSLGDAFVQMRQEGGELPHLLSGFNYQASQWDVGGQVLVDLTSYVNDPTVGFSSGEIRDFQPVFWAQDVVMVNTPAGRIEKRLGIPFHGAAQVLYYNLTWAEELGYDEIPDTPFNLRLQACAATDSLEMSTEEEARGGWMLTADAATLLGWIYAYGGEVYHPLGNGYNFDTEEAVRALEFLRGMIDSDCAWVGESMQAAEIFASRGALLYTGSMMDLKAQEAAMHLAENRDEWTVMPFPAANGGPAIVASGPALVVTQSTPENELAAWLLIKWLVSPQNQANWVQASGYYPTRASTLDLLATKIAGDEHWAMAAGLLPYVHAEPGYASWRVMRWTLGDMLGELFSPEFDPAEIQGLLRRLDAVAEEIHTQVR